MRCGEEGKLLARAAGVFNHPGEADRINEPGNFAMKFSCHAQENSSHCRRSLLFRSAPIRVREKRMNTHMTAKTQESYQKVSK
jgi:hypothetical protein